MIFIKAVIMAGGTGTRLRPVTLGIPKPMARVLDMPLIGHNVMLLKKYGLKDIFVTLRYLPREITDYLGDGSGFGVNIEYVREDEPLGTAGGVRKCFDRCREPLLVLGGDAAVEIDLNEFIRFHYESFASATIAAVKGPDPHEYGTIFASPDGRITGFSEKPSRRAVCGELINTGIYLLGEKVLEALPSGRSDFAKDIFPNLLERGERLFIWESRGYWLDVGTCEALLKANRDALDGKIYSYALPKAPDGVTVRMPSYISANASIKPGSVIGPYAVIGEGCEIEDGATVRSSVLCSAHVGRDAIVDGAILCRGACIGDGTSAGPECVLGENSQTGKGCFLGEGSVLWPGRSIPSGASVSGALNGGPKRFFVEFDEDGRIFGDQSSLTCDLAFSLGRASAAISTRILYSSESDPSSQAMAACFAAGAASGGARATLCDSCCAATLAHSCYLYSAAGLFVSDAAGSPVLSFFGPDGYALVRDAQRKLEAADGAFYVCPSGAISSFTGTNTAHIAAARRFSRKPAFKVKAAPYGYPAKLISEIYSDKKRERPFSFAISRDGFSLTLSDADGSRMNHGELICGVVYREILDGKRELILPDNAPFAARRFAEESGAKVYIRGRDLIPAELPDMTRDGIFIAAALYPLLEKFENVTELRAVLPEFSAAECSFETDEDTRALLRRAATSGYFGSCETYNGLRSEYKGGHIHIMPSGISSIRISAECADYEMASELAADAADTLKKLM